MQCDTPLQSLVLLSTATREHGPAPGFRQSPDCWTPQLRRASLIHLILHSTRFESQEQGEAGDAKLVVRPADVDRVLSWLRTQGFIWRRGEARHNRHKGADSSRTHIDVKTTWDNDDEQRIHPSDKTGMSHASSWRSKAVSAGLLAVHGPFDFARSILCFLNF